MKELSTATRLPGSGIRRMYALAKNKTDLLSFGIGEPDYVTPQYIIDEAVRSLNAGRTHYTENAGILPLREVIASTVGEYDKVSYDPETEVCVTTGAGEALALTWLALLRPGDEVIVADPTFPNYFLQIQQHHAVLVPVPVYEEDGFNYTFERLNAAVTPRTKAIILNSPANPTGSVAGRSDMEVVARVAIEHDLYVVYDAVYKHMLYDNTEYINIAALPGMRERTLYVDSLSKTLAMTGWRVGWVCGPRSVLQFIPKLQESMSVCVPPFVQDAAIIALSERERASAAMDTMRDDYSRRRDMLVAGISEIDGLSARTPRGAFYLFVNISKTGLTSQEFAENLLEEQNVLVAPGSAFGATGEGFVRLSYVSSIETIRAGLKRINDFVKALNLVATNS